MGPSHGGVAGFLQHVLEREVQPQPLQVADHFPGPPHPICSAAFEKGLEFRRVRGEEVSQNVHLAPGRGCGEFTPGHHTDAVALPGCQSLGYSGECIVVGECHRAETGIPGATHHSIRRNSSV